MPLKTLLLLLCALLALSSFAPAYGQSAQPATGLRPFQRESKWGYVDSAGMVRVEPRFAWAEEFSEGLAAVGVKGRWGFVDRRGRVVIRPRFESDDVHLSH